MNNISSKTIFCFWTGTNQPSQQRATCLQQLKEVAGCNVILITPLNLKEYILETEPLHPAYDFLSETHKSDYLRTYFMHFYGGGYSDIKCTTGSWIDHFESLQNSDKWITGYKEINGGVAYQPYVNYWPELIGNGAYICKPKTPLTEEWYTSMILFLDTKLDALKQYPSTFPQDRAEVSNGKYPIEWNEMLGRIFHRVCYKYKDQLMNTLPISIFHSYR
jgi:hypothetical protein